jgi:hypothetical protein
VRLGELSDDMTDDHGKDDRDGTTNRDGPQHAFQTGIGYGCELADLGKAG